MSAIFRNRHAIGLSVSALALTLATPALAAGAEAPAQPAAEPTPQEIVVTGTAGGRGTNRLAASFAVTSVSAADLVKASPKSAAEVLGMVPGVWVESSGGVAGANIMVRGLPSTGDAPFVSYQLMGNPVFPTASLSFMENSSIFREDLTIRSIETVNGGTGAVYSIGEPGLTVNHVLVEGTDQTMGEVKGSVTTYGTKRVDAILSGKLAEDLNFMVGGYVTSSPGPRPTQFDSETGQQITASLTKHFDGGKITVYSRYTNDHGAWYLPFAYATPGINQGTYTQLGNYSRFATIQTGANTTQTFDLAKGRGWKGTMSGINLEKTFGDGWAVHAKLGYTEGDANTLGLVNDGSAVTVASVLAANPSISSLSANIPGSPTLGGNAYVQSWGQWVVLKHIKSLTQELAISKSFAGNDLTLGYYGANYSSDDYWSLGNFQPMLVQANGPYVNATSAGVSSALKCSALQNAGSGAGCWTYDIQDSGTTHVNALYLNDQFHITDQLTLDAGLRQEWNRTRFVLYTASARTSGVGLVNPYPDLSAPANSVNDSRNRLSWTAALTYRPVHEMSVYGRLTKGYFNPNFDDYRNAGTGNNPITASVMQYEMGFKYAAHGYFLSLTPFYYHFVGASTGAAFGAVPVFSDNVNVKGIEFQGTAHLLPGLSVNTTATYQDSKIAAGSADTANIGHDYPRQPKFAFNISPNYDFDISGAKVSLFGTVSYKGSRYTDNTNAASLPSFATLALGATVRKYGFELGVFGDNITNSHGLTEGDPRAVLGSSVLNARPIFGRTVKFSLGYRF